MNLKSVLVLAGILIVLGVLLFVYSISPESSELNNSNEQSVIDNSGANEPYTDLEKLVIGDKEYQIEIADTPAERQLGLSGRDKIGSDGLLFVFDEQKQHGFWMKDMKFALDFIWIADGQVVEITSQVPPAADGQSLNQLPVYQPAVPIDSMLEVVAGFAAQNGIQVGDRVSREYQ